MTNGRKLAAAECCTACVMRWVWHGTVLCVCVGGGCGKGDERVREELKKYLYVTLDTVIVSKQSEICNNVLVRRQQIRNPRHRSSVTPDCTSKLHGQGISKPPLPLPHSPKVTNTNEREAVKQAAGVRKIMDDPTR